MNAYGHARPQVTRLPVPARTEALGPSLPTVEGSVLAGLQAEHGNHFLAAALAGQEGGAVGDLACEEIMLSFAGIHRETSNQARLARMASIPDPTGGMALPEAVRVRMEAALGHGFEHARIHTDGAAARAASDLDAHAFAIGAHIWFGAGAYQPGTPEGDELLLHELVHVMQHDEARLPTATTGDRVSAPSDPAEREAEATARAALADLPSTAAPVEGHEHAPDAFSANGAFAATAPAVDGGAESAPAASPAASAPVLRDHRPGTAAPTGPAAGARGSSQAGAAPAGGTHGAPGAAGAQNQQGQQGQRRDPAQIGRDLRVQVRRIHDATTGERTGHQRLTDLRRNHSAVGATAEFAGELREGALGRAWDAIRPSQDHEVRQTRPNEDAEIALPAMDIWSAVFTKIDEAYTAIGAFEAHPTDESLRAVRAPVDGARHAYEACTRRVSQYRERTERGAEVAADGLRGVVAACGVVATLCTGGLMAAALGAAATTTAGIAVTATVTAEVAGGYALATGVAGQTSEVAHGERQSVDMNGILRESAATAVTTFVTTFTGGVAGRAFASVFTNTLAPLAIQRGFPQVAAALRGGSGAFLADFLSGAGMTPLNVAVTHVVARVRGQRADPNHPLTFRSFMRECVDEMVSGGVMQLLVGAASRNGQLLGMDATRSSGGAHGSPPAPAAAAGNAPAHAPAAAPAHTPAPSAPAADAAPAHAAAPSAPAAPTHAPAAAPAHTPAPQAPARAPRTPGPRQALEMPAITHPIRPGEGPRPGWEAPRAAPRGPESVAGSPAPARAPHTWSDRPSWANADGTGPGTALTHADAAAQYQASHDRYRANQAYERQVAIGGARTEPAPGAAAPRPAVDAHAPTGAAVDVHAPTAQTGAVSSPRAPTGEYSSANFQGPGRPSTPTGEYSSANFQGPGRPTSTVETPAVPLASHAHAPVDVAPAAPHDRARTGQIVAPEAAPAAPRAEHGPAASPARSAPVGEPIGATPTGESVFRGRHGEPVMADGSPPDVRWRRDDGLVHFTDGTTHQEAPAVEHNPEAHLARAGAEYRRQEAQAGLEARQAHTAASGTHETPAPSGDLAQFAGVGRVQMEPVLRNIPEGRVGRLDLGPDHAAHLGFSHADGLGGRPLGIRQVPGRGDVIVMRVGTVDAAHPAHVSDSFSAGAASNAISPEALTFIQNHPGLSESIGYRVYRDPEHGLVMEIPSTDFTNSNRRETGQGFGGETIVAHDADYAHTEAERIQVNQEMGGRRQETHQPTGEALERARLWGADSTDASHANHAREDQARLADSYARGNTPLEQQGEFRMHDAMTHGIGNALVPAPIVRRVQEHFQVVRDIQRMESRLSPEGQVRWRQMQDAQHANVSSMNSAMESHNEALMMAVAGQRPSHEHVDAALDQMANTGPGIRRSLSEQIEAHAADLSNIPPESRTPSQNRDLEVVRDAQARLGTNHEEMSEAQIRAETDAVCTRVYGAPVPRQGPAPRQSRSAS